MGPTISALWLAHSLTHLPSLGPVMVVIDNFDGDDDVDDDSGGNDNDDGGYDVMMMMRKIMMTMST